jgi:hypothetical protein
VSDYYTTAKDEIVNNICSAAFPDYKGRNVQIEFVTGALDLTYRDDYSYLTYKIVRLSDYKVTSVPYRGTNDDPIPEYKNYDLPAGAVVVVHKIVHGKNYGLYIYARTESFITIPERSDDLSEIETRVLIITDNYKSSYAGFKDYRAVILREKFGYKQSLIEAARKSLKQKGYMTANKAITNKGRSAIANHPDNHP